MSEGPTDQELIEKLLTELDWACDRIVEIDSPDNQRRAVFAKAVGKILMERLKAQRFH